MGNPIYALYELASRHIKLLSNESKIRLIKGRPNTFADIAFVISNRIYYVSTIAGGMLLVTRC